jgi:hypothetical protein
MNFDITTEQLSADAFAIYPTRDEAVPAVGVPQG